MLLEVSLIMASNTMLNVLSAMLIRQRSFPLVPENATFFYQKSEWISGRDMYYIDTRGIDEYACLFITSCLQPIAEKYSYNYGMFPDLLKEEKIKLPANEKGDPDYVFMRKYMENVESKAHNVIKNLLAI